MAQVELAHVLQKCDDIFSLAKRSDVSVIPRSLSAADIPSLAPASASLGLSSPAAVAPTAPGSGIDLETGGCPPSSPSPSLISP